MVINTNNLTIFMFVIFQPVKLEKSKFTSAFEDTDKPCALVWYAH